MLPIVSRLSEARRDALMSGHRPVKARISPLDMKELDAWVRQQNRPHVTGLPTPTLTKDRMFGMDIVEDSKVRDIIVLEMKK